MREAQPRHTSMRGARGQRPRKGSQLRAWARHHRAMCRDSATRLIRHPLASLLTMLAIAIALILPAGLWLTLDSARLLDAELDESATLTAYLEQAVGDAEAGRVTEALRAHEGVAEARLITAEAGMREFQESLGLEDALARLENNPLPASVVISPRDTAPEEVEQLAGALEEVSGVDEVRLDLAWLERLRRLAELGQRLVLALGGLFGLGVLLIVGNTIRLSVESRRQEIEVVTLIGATHAFVRRPFLYSGAWYGLGGGLLAWMLLSLGGHWLASPVTALAESYGADYRMPSLDWLGSAVLLFSSTLLGWSGAWVAVNRHLADIRPR
ncbi:permease-like cell division protein FtsX [Aidingimonas halophila]|uniref:Cell division protein FtsX n=1 Tax=Aidingimonas halophila TaxID=574349 RepID=A0A1H2VPJ2_9GAMM|nr:permease-like cell division protein FtsX [Aidingimonas halophila]GHC24652.1 cell division protein FtsX [Aidingimonas halophila]SDW70312.1 cell division protein FtsX [Aidingimonas halophila]